MSIFSWLKKLAAPSGTGNATGHASGVTSDDAPPELTAAEKDAMMVGGLDFLDAITAHQKWKTRLTNYVAKTSPEKLDYRQICRDDQCVLGKWINGNGSHLYGHIPLFSQLKISHAQFHIAAGSIVQMADAGNLDQAKTALRQGDYSKHSVKVQGLISSLYTEVKQ